MQFIFDFLKLLIIETYRTIRSTLGISFQMLIIAVAVAFLGVAWYQQSTDLGPEQWTWVWFFSFCMFLPLSIYNLIKAFLESTKISALLSYQLALYNSGLGKSFISDAHAKLSKHLGKDPIVILDETDVRALAEEAHRKRCRKIIALTLILTIWIWFVLVIALDQGACPWFFREGCDTSRDIGTNGFLALGFLFELSLRGMTFDVFEYLNFKHWMSAIFPFERDRENYAFSFFCFTYKVFIFGAMFFAMREIHKIQMLKQRMALQDDSL